MSDPIHPRDLKIKIFADGADLDGIREMGLQFAFPTRSVEFVGGKFPELTVAGVPKDKPAANHETQNAMTNG